jgi:hypothetical protein
MHVFRHEGSAVDIEVVRKLWMDGREQGGGENMMMEAA